MKIFRLKDHRSSLTLLGEPKKAKRREGEKRQKKKGHSKKKEGKKGRAAQYSSSFANWEGNGLIPFFLFVPTILKPAFHVIGLCCYE
ncbi:hypothetical protein BDV39DRAFT_63812 [Aspergillus sergii]|uniref:Uncharacterized protein n=1 Tax=Aspergillus sergii TaxID=1034303 RepID=A0A5N6X9W0_9EURO|nr:hypothetical protein BDV39DRAFT_63812 [Aspergillus sergii]